VSSSPARFIICLSVANRRESNSSIQLEKVGNWGDRNSAGYYQSNVTANNAPASGVTIAELHELTASANGGVTGKLLVDSHVRSDGKGQLADRLEQDHPDGWKDFYKNLSDKVLNQLIKDPRTFHNLEELGRARAEHVGKLFKAEKDRQNLWDGPDGKHNLKKRKDG